MKILLHKSRCALFLWRHQCRNNLNGLIWLEPPALIPRGFSANSYESDLSVCIQRKYTVIFQQGPHIPSQYQLLFMICFLIRYNPGRCSSGQYKYSIPRSTSSSTASSSLPPVLLSQSVCHCILRNKASPDPVRPESFHPVIYSAPVTNDAAFVSHSFLRISVRRYLFSSIFSIYFIVATHDGSWKLILSPLPQT